MSPNILYISKGLNSPSTRYRASQFTTLFEEKGWVIRHLVDKKGWLGKIAILMGARSATAVVVIRKTYDPIFMFLLRSFSKCLLFDFDDAIFCKSNGGVSRSRKNGFRRMVANCDYIWAGNNFLAKKVEDINDNVVVLPTSVDIDKYAISASKPRETFDLVWIGSSSTKKHLLTILPALEKAAEVIDNLRLKIIADFDLKTDSLTVVPVPWDAKTEAVELVSSHVGIAPLPDNTYTRGKCALKVLQYMAAGLPVISSPNGVNSTVLKNGENGFLASTDDEWIETIVRLSKDKELCVSVGNIGRQDCACKFSLVSTFQKMLASLETVVGT